MNAAILFCFILDCKTVGFFLKISKEIGKAWRKSLTRAKREPHTPVGRVRREKNLFYYFIIIFSVSPQSSSLFSASFQTFSLTARAYLNAQKYGLFCSLVLFCLLVFFFLSIPFFKLKIGLNSSLEFAPRRILY